MKKPRTLKDLQNHPSVCSVEREYNPGAFDESDYTYWLYLKADLWFEEEQCGCLHEWKISTIIAKFNSMTIGVRKD